MKVEWSGDVAHLHFGGHQPYLSNGWSYSDQLCTPVGYIKSQHIPDKSPLKGRGQGQVTHIKFWGPNNISGTAKVRVVKFCTQIDYIIS